MSRAHQYIDAAGLRKDGRRPHECRPLSVAFGAAAVALAHHDLAGGDADAADLGSSIVGSGGADGAVVVSLGGTVVSATCVGPAPVANRADARADGAVLTADVAVAAFAGERRRAVPRHGRLNQELSCAVLGALEAVVLLQMYPGSEVAVTIDVLQSDGGEQAAAITAASLALAHAKVAMRDVLVASSAGLVDGVPLVDPTGAEGRSKCPVVSLATLAHAALGVEAAAVVPAAAPLPQIGADASAPIVAGTAPAAPGGAAPVAGGKGVVTVATPEAVEDLPVVGMAFGGRVEEATFELLHAAACVGCRDAARAALAALRAATVDEVEARGVTGFVHTGAAGNR